MNNTPPQSPKIDTANGLLNTLARHFCGMIYQCQTSETAQISSCSEGCLALTGYTAAQLCNDSFGLGQLVHPEDWPKLQSHWQQEFTHSKQATSSIDIRLLRADNSVVWVRNHSSGIADARGELIAIEGVMTDISESKQQEVTFAATQNQLQDLYDHAPDMLLSINPDTGQVASCNLTLCNTLGYYRNEIIDKSVFELYTPESTKRVQQELLPQFLATGQLNSIELQVRRKDGVILDVLLSSTAIRDDSGKIILTRSSWRNITELKVLERLQQRNASRFELIMSAIPVPCAINAPDLVISYLNPAFSATFGYTEDDLPNLRVWWEKAYPDPAYRQWIKEQWGERLHNARTIGADFAPLPVRIRCKSGEIKPVLAFATPLSHNWNGEHLVALIDTSSQEQQQHELMLREQRYRSLFETANISIWHEDMSGVVIKLNELRAAGVSDLNRYLTEHPDALIEFVSLFKVTDVNPATEALFGANKHQLLGDISQVFGRGALCTIKDELLHFWEQKPHFSSEVNLQTFDKQAIRAIISFPIPATIEDARNVPVCIQDLSVSQELKNQLALQSEILENIHQGIHLTRASDGIIIYTNPVLEQMFGYQAEQLIGQHVSILNANANQDPVQLAAQIMACLRNQGHWEGEVHNQRQDGTPFWTRASVSSHEHPSLGPIWISVQRDITAEIQARHELDYSHAQLQAIANIQGKFIENQDERIAFNTVLQQICKICECEFGFIAEVLYKADGTPYLRANAISNLAWDSHSQQLYEQYIDEGRDFHHLDTLFGAPLKSGKVLICNDAALADSASRPPQGHPSMNNYMIIPVFQGGNMIAEIGMANRAQGFDGSLAELLQPIMLTYSQLIMALRNKRESRKATEALHQRDLLWKKAIEGAGHGVWDWNIQLNTMAFSHTWTDLLGYQPEELSSNPQEWFERIHREDLPQLKNILQTHLNQETDSFSAEHRLRCKDGSYKWMLARGTVIQRAEDGSAIRMIGTSTDISKRKAAEDELLASRAQLAGMIDTAMDAIVTTDAEFNIILFNRAAEQMFGYPAYKVLGCPIELLIPVRFAAGHRANMHRFASHGEHTRKMQVAKDREVKGLRADGSEFPLEVAISYSENYGNPIYTAMIRDITERKEHEQSLVDLTASLEIRVRERTAELEAARVLAESANKAKSAFVANMSHEIRTPLNSVLGMAHLALKTELNDKQRDYLTKISRSGAHLLELINDILDFSKIEAGKLELDIGDFSLANLCHEIQELLEPKAIEKQLRFELTLDPSLQLAVQGDALRLKQVLVNLIGNAIKFTEHGVIKLQLTQLAQTDQANQIRFSVIDSGIGISLEAQTRLFQSFQQADNSTTRKYGGTGLGLAISRQLIELMGGQLTLKSQINEGSEFSFCLTLPAAKTALEIAAPMQQDMNYIAILAGKRILLADDHPFNQQVAQDILAEVGVEVRLANDGYEAIQLAETEEFDAILMDIQMPNMDGYTACKILRSETKFEHLPIIAMTANAAKEDRDQCIAAGMNDFLSKPVQPEKLYRALVYWLVGSDIKGSQGNTPEKTSMQYIDLQTLEAMLGPQAERQRKYLNRFVVAMQEGLAKIERSLQSGALQQIGPECHRLKSIARTVGAMALGERLGDLDGKKSAISAETIADKVAELKHLFNLSSQELSQHGLIEHPTSSPQLPQLSVPLDTSLRIMLVDDDDFSLEVIAQHLRDLGFTYIESCLDGHTALKQLRQTPLPDWILCDLQMPDMDGIAFLRLLGQSNYRGQVAILSGMDNTVLKATEKLGQSFALNIHGALRKPVKKSELAQLLNEVRFDTVPAPAVSPLASNEALDYTELQRGLAHGAIELYYQPKVSTSDRRVIGAECLARWRHPTRGLLSPNLFVPAIETLGLVDDLTFNVLHQAVKQLKEWLTQGVKIKLSVNVSMDNLHRLELPEMFAQIVEENGIAADSIILEVTETQLSHDYVLSLDILTRLRIKGFGLSIDDFGTGFSTMEHLLQTPFTELKIDRAFVRGASDNPSAKTILEHSVMLGTKFNLNLVAEGVETQADWQLIAEVGCHEAQGYLIARPMPAEEFIAWKSQWENTNNK